MTTTIMPATSTIARLTPTARLVYERLTELADAHGRVEISTAHLATLTNLHRVSVQRHINDLESRDLLMRLPRVRNHAGRGGITRIQLITHTPAPIHGATPAQAVSPSTDAAEPVCRDDLTGLADLAMRLAVNTSDSEALAILAATVTSEGPAQFAHIATTRTHMAGHADAVSDTCQEAFLTFLDHAGTIAGADNPWAMWTRLTHHTINHAPTTTTTHHEPELDYDDYETGPLARAIHALETAGLTHSHAVNSIRLTIKYLIHGHRYTDTARNVLLARHGITPDAGRELRRLITGTRGEIHQPNCATATEAELARQATKCVALLHGENTPPLAPPAVSPNRDENVGNPSATLSTNRKENQK